MIWKIRQFKIVIVVPFRQTPVVKSSDLHSISLTTAPPESLEAFWFERKPGQISQLQTRACWVPCKPSICEVCPVLLVLHLPVNTSGHIPRQPQPSGSSGKTQQQKSLAWLLCTPFAGPFPWRLAAAHDKQRSATIRDYQVCLHLWKPANTSDYKLYLQLQRPTSIRSSQACQH